MSSLAQQHWAGVDWGDKEHVLCVVAEQGRIVKHFKIDHNPEGMEKIEQTLRAIPNLVGVAIETSRNLLVDSLHQAGFTIYPVSPKLSKNWRKCHTVNAPKDDYRDAWTLAHGLFVQEQELRPLHPQTPAMRALTLLCEQEQKLIKHRTALVCELEAVLKQYYPAALAWIAQWASLNAWRFVVAFPTPKLLAGATKSKILKWFKAHRFPLTVKRLALITERKSALDMAAEETVGEVLAMRATAIARELMALEQGIKAHRKCIEEAFPKTEQAALFDSLPGAGPKLAPRLMCIFDASQERYESATSVCELAGTVPVTSQSGKSIYVYFRRGCKKSYRNTLHHFALCSLKQCPWAHAYYRKCRRAGQNHPVALRNLATKWVKIIYRMVCDNQPYDEARYLQALRKSGSPLADLIGA